MYLDTKNIETSQTVSVSGREDWLGEIYSHFPPPADTERPMIKAEIKVSRIADTESFLAEVQVRYDPYVDCSLCATKIPWHIEESESRYFNAEVEAYPEDDGDGIDLTEEQCDEGTIRDGRINVLELLNDIIMLAIPTRLILAKPDAPDSCAICDRDLEETEVYRESPKPEDDPDNPFQALKALKSKLQ